MEDAIRVALHDHLKACMKLPRRGIRFSEAVFALTGCKVLPFDRDASEDLDLLGRLKKAAETAARDQTLRSFYLSLTDDPKITCDAMHLIFGFELKKLSHAGQNRFFPLRWSVWTLDSLSLQIKYEFNASNRELYAKHGLLAEESL
jgi:hypothetical protein